MPVITVMDLSKEYVVGVPGRRWGALRGGGPGSPGARRVQALRDVSFEVRTGEVLGIIGPNGAGKSTLLKILSRVTEPTAGRAVVAGRLGSLLEAGTGFHPDLTGRENVYLNGAILGMSRAEIRRKFDEIVAFAEIEPFIDTPVKHYSSGMYVRLAFSVAAHLDPEILVVDEILAVGDLRFQKKSLGKMSDVASEGRTILLVSHNMATVLGLSTRCVYLAGGRLVRSGSPAETIRAYQNASGAGDEIAGRTGLAGALHYGSGQARFLTVTVTPKDERGNVLPVPMTGCDLEIDVGVEAAADVVDATVAVTLYDGLGGRLVDANTLIKGTGLTLAKGERGSAHFLLRNVRLRPDTYVVGLWLGVINGGDIDGVRHATSFRMEARREDILYTAPFPGVYACEFACRLDRGTG